MPHYRWLLLVTLSAACVSATAHGSRPLAGYEMVVLRKDISLDGSAWERWRRAGEMAPRPAYIVVTDMGRACLVTEAVFYREVREGSPFSCRWRYPH